MDIAYAMQERLGSELEGFEARDFADWLRAGILTYHGKARVPRHFKPADAFPFARLYIGQNEADLPADLNDVHRDLPEDLKIRFERAIGLLFCEIEFRAPKDFMLAKELLILACRVRAKAFIEGLTSVLPRLAVAFCDFPAEALAVRRMAFQAAVELASGTTQTVLAIETFVSDRVGDHTVVEPGEARDLVLYLARGMPDRLLFWLAIFGRALVTDVQQIGGTAREELRPFFDEEVGADHLQRVIDLVRKDKIDRLRTDTLALTTQSMIGLYDLVAVLQPATADWEDHGPKLKTLEDPASLKGPNVFDLDSFRAELRSFRG